MSYLRAESSLPSLLYVAAAQFSFRDVKVFTRSASWAFSPSWLTKWIFSFSAPRSFRRREQRRERLSRESEYTRACARYMYRSTVSILIRFPLRLGANLRGQTVHFNWIFRKKGWFELTSTREFDGLRVSVLARPYIRSFVRSFVLDCSSRLEPPIK